MMVIEPNILFHDRYRLIELKGRGSFGEVWLARDETLDNMEVAVKIYISLDVRGLQEFGAEYRNTYGLNHPNLLRAYHYEMCEDRPYLVMPYCPGSATSYIGNIDEQKMWQFIHDVASGLAFLHSKDIVHHDIKPDNILEDANGHFVISDFGISVKMRSTLRRNSNRQFNSNALGGSMAYMGPEMFASHAESVKATDIWAFGATLYEMATGELPCFGQGGAMLLNGGEIDRPQVSYSDSLINTILNCLAKETWDRPMAHQLVERANAALAGHPIDVGVPPAGSSDPPQWQPQMSNDPHRTVHFSQRSNDVHGTVKYNKSNESFAPHDNGNAGGTVQEGQSGAPTTTKKKSKAWLWILLVLLFLGGGGGAAWKIIDDQKKAEHDDNYYAKCHTANDYRSYLKEYPEGRNVELAQSKLNDLIADSIRKQKELIAQNQSATPKPQPAQEPEPKPMEKPKQKPADKNYTTTSKPSTKNSQEKEDDDIYTKPRFTTKEYGGGVTYEGYAIPGTEVKEGQGTLRESNSKVYTGNWSNNKRNGEGTQYYGDGSWYRGSWKNDKSDGFGEYHYADGSFYKGYFKSGQPNGQGTLYEANGEIKASGYFVNGKLQ